MKKALIFLALVFVGCESNSHKTPETINVGIEVYEYNIEGCQYIGYIGHSSGKYDYLAHKGNCNNHIHKTYNNGE